MRPSFVLFVTDQQRADHLGCYGNSVLRTPAIDRIASQGVCFDRAYVSSAVCMPNRATLMTGRPPMLHGVRHNGLPLPLDAATFVDGLRGAGYRTSLVGKAHFQNMIGPPAFIQLPPGVGEARRPPPGRYDQEIATRWRDDPACELDLPYYGFERVDLAIEHGDAVEGHYSRWLAARHPNPDALRGRRNALPADGADLPQAWRTAVPAELYPTAFVADQAVARLTEFGRDPERPFFLMCSFPDPHHPFTPPGHYWDLYGADDIALPDTWKVDPRRAPPHVRHLLGERDAGTARKNSAAAFACTEREARGLTALNYGTITMIDDAIARIMDALAANGLADRTVKIFTSDHGDFMGDHQLMLKAPIHYQALIRVPLIWSDTPDRRATGRQANLAGTIDIAPTILDRAGVLAPNGMLGRSQLGVLGGGAPPVREALLIEEEGQRTAFGFDRPVRMRTLLCEGHRLSLYEGVEWAELYDLRQDPLEMRNLWGDPAARKVERRMLERLAREMIAASETSPAPLGPA
jgi:arylsulfatase A-like enzyme